MLTARLKGASEFRVVTRHALRNAAIPLVTVIALSYGGLLEGSVLIETIFSWPGIGNYIYSSLFAADMNAVLGGTLLVGVVFVLLNMLSDVLYQRPRSALAGAGAMTDRRHRSQSAPSAPRGSRSFARFARRFLRNPLGVVGLVIVAAAALHAPPSRPGSRRTIPICPIAQRPPLGARAPSTGSAPTSSAATSIRASSTARG